MFFALAYLLLRRLVRLSIGSSNEQMDTEVELVVLRHQLKVLKRQSGRPRLRRRDRLFLAAISRGLPRARWTSFVVSPQTLLRWHPELVRRKWTYGRRPCGGRPPIRDEVRELILRMGGRTPGGGESGSEGSWPSSASGSRPRRSARCCGRTASARFPGEPVLPGASSCGPRRMGSCRSTSSPPRRCGFAPCTSSSPSSSAEPRLGVGHPASPQPGGGGEAPRNPVRDPGPGRQVLRSLRRSLPLRGREHRQDPDPSSPSERIRGALGPHSPDRMPGLDTRVRPPSLGAGASNLRCPTTTGEGPTEAWSCRHRTR